jgi:membrane protease subunit (stomatin/prohibitin family)
MTEKIDFTHNYTDLSTERGFQFEFHCDRCGNGIRTHFKPSVTGMASGVMDAASSLLGGIFSGASDLTSRVHSAAWERAHDAAFIDAVKEIRPNFVQCPRCSTWVCREKCWNTRTGLCKNCSPDYAVEASAAQASRTVEEIWAHSKMAEEDREMLKEKSWRDGIRASCPNCEAPLAKNVKFCPECGAKVKTEQFCTECGATVDPNAKFCPDCGHKLR